jgi:hypothetical protein
MELTKKTTILFPPELHSHLAQVAQRQGVSLGQLVRSACERAYGRVSTEDRLKALAELVAMDLPVGTPAEMEAESIPAPEDLG